MEELIKINEDLTVNARSVYDKLFSNELNSTPFNKWISRRISEYNFINKIDFWTILSKSTGGRPQKEYIISLDMAKELCMVEKSEVARNIRKYFIEAEKKLRSIYSETELRRIAGIEIRKSMTDTIKEKGINDKMHGFAYSAFTKLVYKKLNINYIKDNKFRDKLSSVELKMIETMESLIKNYIELGYEYSKIKEILPEILIQKENINAQIDQKTEEEIK